MDRMDRSLFKLLIKMNRFYIYFECFDCHQDCQLQCNDNKINDLVMTVLLRKKCISKEKIFASDFDVLINLETQRPRGIFLFAGMLI